MSASPLEPALEAHCRAVVNAIRRGHVVPFLGAGANLCGRPSSAVWQSAAPEFLPSGAELSAFLADSFDCGTEAGTDLSRVCQSIDLYSGLGPLYSELRRLFNRDFQPTAVHRFLAKWPALMKMGAPHSTTYPVIVTTNYDDLLEQAFLAENEQFDVVTYMAQGPDRGKFLHLRPTERTPLVIDKPNEYIDVSPSRRTVILKIHGAVDRDGRGQDSFVITEDQYIDYLARIDLAGLIPINLLVALRQCHFLFLGYSLRDWNLRVILRRIERDWEELAWTSWAVQRRPTELDRKFWQLHKIDVLDLELETYIRILQERLSP